jgi:uncharacterized protein with GYD domain
MTDQPSTIYLRLLKLTEAGLGAFTKDMRAFADELEALVVENGGSSVATYITQGKVDLVSVVEVPDADAITAIARATKASPHIHGSTDLAIPFDEFQAVFMKNPHIGAMMGEFFRVWKASGNNPP